jgi:hypothetical protein
MSERGSGGAAGPVFMSGGGAGGSAARMRQLEIGRMGILLGGGEHGKSHIGFIIILCLCVLLGLSMFLPVSVSGGNATVFPALLSAIAGGLGYIFGGERRSMAKAQSRFLHREEKAIGLLADRKINKKLPGWGFQAQQTGDQRRS